MNAFTDCFPTCCFRLLAGSFLVLALLAMPSNGRADNFTVINTDDSGPGSLRATIDAANASANTPHLIEFNIPGDGPHLIRLDSELPPLSRATAIDATFELIEGLPGIQLDGSNLSSGSGINFSSNADGSLIVGLSITGFPRFGIVSQADNVGILACYIGVAPDGETAIGNGEAGISSLGDGAIIGSSFANGNLISGDAAVPNGGSGIRGDASSTIIVGGVNPGQGNLISGNESYGIALARSTLLWTIQGNTIGLDLAGAAAVSNGAGGILLSGASHHVGGSGAEGRNVVSGNQNAGILLSGEVSNISIVGNYLGTNAGGTASAGVQSFGVRAVGQLDGCTIGGNNAALGNLISGNAMFGVVIGESAFGCQVSGNRIGTDVNGENAIANGVGVDLNGSENMLGGEAPGEANVISGNTLQGVILRGNENEVSGNLIGLDASGSEALSNGASGIRVLSASAAIIGRPGLGNVISANLGHGIVVEADSSEASVRGNIVGLDAAGSGLLGNSRSGLSLRGSGHVVGFPDLDGANVISGNHENGIVVQADQVRLIGNYIGTDSSGTLGLGNGQSGVRVISGNGIVVGGLQPGEGNLVSGNGIDGVTLDNSSAGVLLQQNRVGTDFTGNAAIPNGGNGVSLIGNDHQVGGAHAAAGNLISGNAQNGLLVSGGGFSIAGNRIGSNSAGSHSLGNGGYGVRIFGSGGGVLGGDLPAHGNLISGNARGVSLEQGTRLVSVFNNTIGLDLSQSYALASNGSGIQVFTGENLIGAPGKGNVIAGHGDNGLVLDAGAEHNLIQGNWIGTNQALEPGLGNGDAGVLANLANNNLIGGTAPGEGNVIAGNRLAAVRSGRGDGNEISGNAIFDNGFSGIDIGEFLLNTNDALDQDQIGNRKQNFPLLFSATASSGLVDVEVRLNNEPDTWYRVEFFASSACDSTGFGEGQVFVDSRAITTNASGAAVAEFTLSQPGPQAFMTATVTDAEGNTSEFSPCLEIGVQSAGQIQFFHDTVLAYEGVLPTARVIVTRSHGFHGSVSAEFTISDNTAFAGLDYSDTDRLVRFQEGQSVKVIEIPLLVDPAIEDSPELAQLALTSPSGGAVLGQDAAELLIFDEDTSRPGLTIEDVALTEGQTGSKVFSFSVSLSASDHPVTVDFETFDGSAIAGEDYVPNQGSLSFATSEVEQQRRIEIEILGDPDFEPDETFFVRIFGRPSGGAWVAFDSTATGLIENDDQAPLLEVLFVDGFED